MYDLILNSLTLGFDNNKNKSCMKGSFKIGLLKYYLFVTHFHEPHFSHGKNLFPVKLVPFFSYKYPPLTLLMVISVGTKMDWNSN